MHSGGPARQAIRCSAWNSQGSGAARPDAAWLRQVFPDLPQADWIEYDDGIAGNYRAALLVDGRLEACLMVSATGALARRSWLASLFSQSTIDAADRRCILLGQRQDGVDPGPTVCACFGSGRQYHSRCHQMPAAAASTR